MPPLQIDNEDQKQKYITQLSQVASHPGWKLILNHLRDLKEKKHSVILRVGGNELEYTAKDILIVEHEYIEELIGLPEKLIGELQGVKGPKPENPDPYAD